MPEVAFRRLDGSVGEGREKENEMGEEGGSNLSYKTTATDPRNWDTGVLEVIILPTTCPHSSFTILPVAMKRSGEAQRG